MIEIFRCESSLFTFDQLFSYKLNGNVGLNIIHMLCIYGKIVDVHKCLNTYYPV